jgi:hypothetical protein
MPKQTPRPLFPERACDLRTLTDYLYTLCCNIEETLLYATDPGAYTALDILRLAMPFALEQWNSNGLEMTTAPGARDRLKRPDRLFIAV